MNANKVDVTERVREWIRAKYGTEEEGEGEVFVAADADGNSADALTVFAEQTETAFPNNSSTLRVSDWKNLFREILNTLKSESTKKSEEDALKLDKQDRRMLKLQFAQRYVVGEDAPKQLQNYIIDCWTRYCDEGQTTKVPYPYTTIVQSSGFGKSRLARELAQRTKDKEEETMNVLYLCVRQGKSSGYPETTAAWSSYLFPDDEKTDAALVNELSKRLQTVFYNAMQDWDSVGEDCFAHFENPTAGESTLNKLTAAIPDNKTTSSQGSPAANEKRTDSQDEKPTRILVLVLDEARWLLTTSDTDHTGWFRRFRRALAAANEAIQVNLRSKTGIFAVLIDTNSKISNFTPPSALDPSSRGTRGASVLLAPFILTHTMDIMLDADIQTQFQRQRARTSVEYYRALVHLDTEPMRDALVDMGRPLWQTYKVAKSLPKQQRDEWLRLLRLAADKLVGGQDVGMAVKTSGSESSRFGGIAALLCRLGIRPYSWSPLAARVVADHMAVLSYSSCSHDQFVSSYSSEPILTFGAAFVWYKVVPEKSLIRSSSYFFEHQILPELQKMLHQEVLDTGGVGELVAKILLLLAMDATGVVVTTNNDKRSYDGAFYSVETFLKTLSGDSKRVREKFTKKSPIKVDGLFVDGLFARWKGWQVGFSHFVQLESEPTKDVLWATLARRAACALPRNCKGVDLMIPIFKPEQANPKQAQVSMILIQVKNREDGDPKNGTKGYPYSAYHYTRPKLVFKGPLKETEYEDVVRVYMSLRGHDPLDQHFLVDPGEQPDKSPTSDDIAAAEIRQKKSMVLCLRGLNEWSTAGTRGNEVSVVSKGMASQLRDLLAPWQKLKGMVEADLAGRELNTGMEADKVLAIAMRPLVESLLVEKWDRLTPPTSAATRTLSEITDAAGEVDTSSKQRPKKRKKKAATPPQMKSEVKGKGKAKP